MGVPCLGLGPERHIAVARLNIVVIVELLESELVALVVELAHTFKHILVERTVNIRERIAAQLLAHEVNLHVFKQPVGGCQVSVTGIVGLLTLCLVARKSDNRMRAVALGIARADLGQIDCLGNQSSAHRLVNCRVFILDPVAVGLDNTFEFPF